MEDKTLPKAMSSNKGQYVGNRYIGIVWLLLSDSSPFLSYGTDLPDKLSLESAGVAKATTPIFVDLLLFGSKSVLGPEACRFHKCLHHGCTSFK